MNWSDDDENEEQLQKTDEQIRSTWHRMLIDWSDE
jgi:hypothetical protein